MLMDRRLLVLAIGMFAIGTDSFVIAGILPSIAQSMDTSVAVVGQMITLYALSYSLLAPVVAAVCAHWPRKQLLLAGLFVFVVGNVLTATATSLTVLLCSRLVAGLGAAMVNPTSTAMGASLVPPEQRGRALAVVLAGLTTATALGSPIGTWISGLGDWRMTMWFVSVLGVAAAAGIAILLPPVPTPPRVSLRQRLAPMTDARVAMTLLTTLFAYGSAWIVYSYIGVALDRVTHGEGHVLAVLLLIWGVAAFAGNLLGGRLVDAFGGRRIINTTITIMLLVLVTLPWTSAHMASTVIAIIVWGCAGWALLVPQQHRLISIAPAMAPLLLGLNSAGIYLGVSMSGVIGAFGITYFDQYHLGPFAACFALVALVLAEVAHGRIARQAAAEKSPAARAGAERV